MSAEEHHAAACKGKKRFANPTLAHRALRRGQKSRKRIKGRTAYHCGFCGGWHLGVSQMGEPDGRFE